MKAKDLLCDWKVDSFENYKGIHDKSIINQLLLYNELDCNHYSKCAYKFEMNACSHSELFLLWCNKEKQQKAKEEERQNAFWCFFVQFSLFFGLLKCVQ